MDDLALETIGKFNDGSVIGAVCVLLLLLVVYRESWFYPRHIAKVEAEYRAQIAKLEEENERCHTAHDKTRDALLVEVRSGAETLVMFREQLKTVTVAIETIPTIAREIQKLKGRLVD